MSRFAVAWVMAAFALCATAPAFAFNYNKAGESTVVQSNAGTGDAGMTGTTTKTTTTVKPEGGTGG
jgi:hypothetical protein